MKAIKYILVFIVFIGCFGLCAQAATEGSSLSDWGKIESGKVSIFYHPDVDLKVVNARVKIRFRDVILEPSFSASKSNDLESVFAGKINNIIVKVQKILDMYPRRMKITIAIYKNQSQLNQAFLDLFGYSNKEGLISFYLHKYTTVYTTETAIREGVLAHEIGHAVVDHYFVVSPPEKIKEILSQHVEINLDN